MLVEQARQAAAKQDKKTEHHHTERQGQEAEGYQDSRTKAEAEKGQTRDQANKQHRLSRFSESSR